MFNVVNKLSSGLDKASLRHNVLSNNLANFNTPGFKRSDVTMDTFSRELNRVQNSPLMRTNTGHLPERPRLRGQGFSVTQDNQTSMRNDGNNVDPDRERVLLLENQLYYDSLSEAVSRKLGQIRSVIAEGRR